jgi:hypothetical protein
MEYKFLGPGYNPTTLEELSEGYHIETPVSVSEVPNVVNINQDYVTGLFIRGNRKVVFQMRISDP